MRVELSSITCYEEYSSSESYTIGQGEKLAASRLVI